MNLKFVIFSLMSVALTALVQSAPPNGRGGGRPTFPGPRPKAPTTVKGKTTTAADGVPGRFIVTYKAGVLVQNKGKGFEAKGKKLRRLNTLNVITVEDVTDLDLEDLENDPDVTRVEQDGTCSITCRQYDANIPGLWGLDRVDQSGTVYDNKMYVNNTSSGTNVYVYVLDTGVDHDHPDFMGRAEQAYSLVPGQTTDGHGHGTHCAGTIAGANFGIAKKALIKGVKVLTDWGWGYWSWTIAGIDWVITQHQARNVRERGQARTVISMSLGGWRNQAVNDAVKRATDAGITCVVAAGNSNYNAYYFSPASTPTAITVAASDRNDYFAWFSNYGSLVDIVAPGVDVTSAYPSHCANPPPRGKVPDLSHPCMTTATWSGTSMACPHVAGIVANYLKSTKRNQPVPTPAQVEAWVKNNADMGAILNPRPSTTRAVAQLNRCSGKSGRGNQG